MFHGGMPTWSIVGLADTGIKESKDRIKTAIKNCGIELLSRKYIINLSPADVRKEGTGLDLAIAVGILQSIGQIRHFCSEEVLFIGELSLDGKINKINGILPICLEALRQGIKKIILPAKNALEASIVEGIEVIGVRTLKETIEYLNNKIQITPMKSNISKVFKNSYKSELDFSEVKGQESIKRALEVSAAGGHSLLMIRKSSEVGKTMMAKRLNTILPELTFEEALEITKIHSVVGKINGESIIMQRPFRSLHHTITSSALVGGGINPKPRRN